MILPFKRGTEKLQNEATEKEEKTTNKETTDENEVKDSVVV